MEELIISINQLKEVLIKNTLPSWVCYASALGPLVLTIITAIIALLQYKNNVHLQKQLHNREMIVQSRNSILSIYNTCCIAQGLASIIEKEIWVFTTYEGITDYHKKLFENNHPMIQTMNQARLFFEQDNNKLYTTLKTIGEKYFEFQNAVAKYISSGEANLALNGAWNTIGNSYHIQLFNYQMLMSNELAKVQFLQLCETQQVKEIKEKARTFLELLSYDNFDCYFKEYLRISEVK